MNLNKNMEEQLSKLKSQIAKIDSLKNVDKWVWSTNYGKEKPKKL